MVRPGPAPETLERARRLADDGRTRAEIAAELGVSEASVKRWLNRPVGRPRLPDGEGSRVTQWRQKQRDDQDHQE